MNLRAAFDAPVAQMIYPFQKKIASIGSV